jgi:ribosomal-protein-alanine N-acetyltransferase
MGGGTWTTAGRRMTTLGSAALTVRGGLASDLEQVVAIEQACFSDPWTTDAFLSVLALPHISFLVAEERETDRGRGRGGGAALLGYVVAMIIADEGEIADLAVAPRARRKGVGGLLLDLASSQARDAGVQSMYLEVRESNSAAIALYASRGFGTVGRRRQYYRHPTEDALILRRDLGRT